jgi:hypothetical protein
MDNASLVMFPWELAFKNCASNGSRGKKKHCCLVEIRGRVVGMRLDYFRDLFSVAGDLSPAKHAQLSWLVHCCLHAMHWMMSVFDTRARRVDFRNLSTTHNKKAFTMLCSNNTSMAMVTTHVFVCFIGALSDTNSTGDGV